LGCIVGRCAIDICPIGCKIGIRWRLALSGSFIGRIALGCVAFLLCRFKILVLVLLLARTST
jgi:hypothetical protein